MHLATFWNGSEHFRQEFEEHKYQIGRLPNVVARSASHPAQITIVGFAPNTFYPGFLSMFDIWI